MISEPQHYGRYLIECSMSFWIGKVFPKIKRKGVSSEANGNDADDATATTTTTTAATTVESSDYVFRIISKSPQEHSGNERIN